MIKTKRKKASEERWAQFADSSGTSIVVPGSMQEGVGLCGETWTWLGQKYSLQLRGSKDAMSSDAQPFAYLLSSLK